MVTFQIEPIRIWRQDAMPLIRDHWQELGLDLDLKIDPNFEAMTALEEKGMWKVLTAREGTSLVGYVLAILSPHLHYKSSPSMFIVDAYYVKPEYRTGVGVRLLKFAEVCAKLFGAIKIYLTCKVHKDHSRLFERLGYSLSDYAFIKRI